MPGKSHKSLWTFSPMVNPLLSIAPPLNQPPTLTSSTLFNTLPAALFTCLNHLGFLFLSSTEWSLIPHISTTSMLDLLSCHLTPAICPFINKRKEELLSELYTNSLSQGLKQGLWIHNQAHKPLKHRGISSLQEGGVPGKEGGCAHMLWASKNRMVMPGYDTHMMNVGYKDVIAGDLMEQAIRLRFLSPVSPCCCSTITHIPCRAAPCQYPLTPLFYTREWNL
ncbi:hypothetical protein E2C01_025355 [Portunus trituberculatus]|uniref:Uncharacterized protein n=1 Tax=Portunus trituberculatus TaxID=210409 RepID=A0A5B7ECQ8_PORTR|nr:hypothetical protein [Portunus trituberculatus]